MARQRDSIVITEPRSMRQCDLIMENLNYKKRPLVRLLWMQDEQLDPAYCSIQLPTASLCNKSLVHSDTNHRVCGESNISSLPNNHEH